MQHREGSLGLPQQIANDLTKIKTAIVGLCIAGGLGASLLIQHQEQATIRDQRVPIQEQARQLQHGGKYAAASGSDEPIPSQPNSKDDLARLRREVGSLQGQTNILVALRKENRHLHEARKSPLQRVEASSRLINPQPGWEGVLQRSPILPGASSLFSATRPHSPP